MIPHNPRTLPPSTLSPPDPYTLLPFHPRFKNPVKMQVKCCFLFLFGSLVALSWPQNHVKMHVFSSCKQKNTVNMQVKCIFWGPRAPKSSQLGLLRCGVEDPFKLSYKTRKHCKTQWFLASVGFLGACLPPPHQQKKGALQPGSFYTPNHKTACYGGIFGLLLS